MISSIMCAVGIIVAIQTFGGWIWLTGVDLSMRILGYETMKNSSHSVTDFGDFSSFKTYVIALLHIQVFIFPNRHY